MSLSLPLKHEIIAASELLKGKKLISPLIKVSDIYLKLDSQLPSGSYKIRGVEFFMANRGDSATPLQVLSAGNLALALAMKCRCEALVPEGISSIKRQRLLNEGAIVTEKPFSQIWQWVERTDLYTSTNLLHPFNRDLLAGYGTIIGELQLAGINDGTLVVPFGLGGLATALCCAIEQLDSNIKIVLVEISNHAPYKRAKSAGQPINGDKLQSYIEAMGTPIVLTPIFNYLQSRIHDVVEVTEEEVSNAIIEANSGGLRIEGAAGASYAAAQKMRNVDPIIALMTGSTISDETLAMLSCHRKDRKY